MNFERGQDPHKAIGIGKESILKEIGGIIVSGEEAKKWREKKFPGSSPWFNATGDLPEGVNVVIQVENGRYEVLRNRISDGSNRSLDMEEPKLKGLEPGLFDLLKKLLEDFRKYGADLGWALPGAKNIAAQTIGTQLVSVQPLSAPIGKLFYISPKRENIFRRIFKKIRDAFRKR